MNFFWNRTNNAKLDEKGKHRLLRRVFLSADGRELLKILLYDWHFFDVCENGTQRAMNEYAKIFIDDLRIAGVDVTSTLDTTTIQE